MPRRNARENIMRVSRMVLGDEGEEEQLSKIRGLSGSLKLVETMVGIGSVFAPKFSPPYYVSSSSAGGSNRDYQRMQTTFMALRNSANNQVIRGTRSQIMQVRINSILSYTK